MGKMLSKIFGNKEMRILMLGLDAAGKTSKTEKKSFSWVFLVIFLKNPYSIKQLRNLKI